MLETQQTSPEAALIERVNRSSFTMKEVCREAKVAASTPCRWSSRGFEAKGSTIAKMNEALDRLIARGQDIRADAA
ncbi:hypothetical protein [Sphingomonas sp. CCH9-E2]|uniref:hypothetical protein n=1 Tax=Sphingomonas sp. CCH9-E2 TaxID=1768776 RepID=UPI00082BE79A|nr:hypothetical protein [Sphingomonas sp. CCH9-E2]